MINTVAVRGRRPGIEVASYPGRKKNVFLQPGYEARIEATCSRSPSRGVGAA